LDEYSLAFAENPPRCRMNQISRSSRSGTRAAKLIRRRQPKHRGLSCLR